VMPAPNV